MSFDRHLDQSCNHTVANEILESEDGLSFRPVVPIASAASVVIKVNGTQTVPASGLYSSPVIHGTTQGPFSIPSGGNTLSFLVDGTQTVNLTLPSGSGFRPATLRDKFNAVSQPTGISCVVDKNRLIFQLSGALGPRHTLKVLPSPLNAVLGLQEGRVSQGKVLYPGWTLVTDPTELFTIPYRVIVFDTPLPFGANFAEVSYVTTQRDCRRCNGTGLEFDWRYDNRGNTGEVRDDALLLQELLKIFLTDFGSNPFHPWYGTTLSSRIGSKITDGQAVTATISADISDAFKRWQSIKRAQENTVGQFVSDDEYPYRLLGINVFQDPQDAITVFVSVTIQKRSGKAVDLTRGFKLPAGSVTAGLFRQSIGKYQRVLWQALLPFSICWTVAAQPLL